MSAVPAASLAYCIMVEYIPGRSVKNLEAMAQTTTFIISNIIAQTYFLEYSLTVNRKGLR